jgi:hypothetical protein
MMPAITRSVISPDHRVDILPNAMAALWSRTSILKEFWEVVQTVGNWPGAGIVRDRRGLRLTINGVKLGHLDWDGRLVLPFGPKMRDELVTEKMANRDRDTGRSFIDIRTAADVNRALWLLRFAYLIADSKENTCAIGLPYEPSASML